MKNMIVSIALICCSLVSSSVFANDETLSFRLTGQVLDQLTHVQIPGSKVEIMKLGDSTVIDSTEATRIIVSGDDRRKESKFTLKILISGKMPVLHASFPD